MSYRLINANTIAESYTEVHDMPCIYADLPRGLDGCHYDMRGMDELQAENAKLRELCRCFAEYVSQDRCEGCVYKSRCNDGLVDECWQRTEIRKMARELGVEADG